MAGAKSVPTRCGQLRSRNLFRARVDWKGTCRSLLALFPLDGAMLVYSAQRPDYSKFVGSTRSMKPANGAINRGTAKVTPASPLTRRSPTDCRERGTWDPRRAPSLLEFAPNSHSISDTCSLDPQPPQETQTVPARITVVTFCLSFAVAYHSPFIVF